MTPSRNKPFCSLVALCVALLSAMIIYSFLRSPTHQVIFNVIAVFFVIISLLTLGVILALASLILRERFLALSLFSLIVNGVPWGWLLFIVLFRNGELFPTGP